ncbi:MAG: hypothetical protein EOP00_03210 [Pedobacter sp.]|nr:MAG: hypothetical protein EOP00_03210 [Pedobacter sp.]
MARRKDIRSKLEYHQALKLEKTGDHNLALKLYQKSSTIDPSNIHAWNRQMILFRKYKSKSQEIALVKSAIAAYRNSIQTSHKQWLALHQEKAESTRELATVLGLIEPDGMPKTEYAILTKWETRLYLLEYRLKNSRPKKSKAKSKTKHKSTAKAVNKPATKKK